MILAPLSDPILRATVRRAALPEEDVFHRMEAVQEGLRLGFPRLLVFQPEDRFLHGELHRWESRVPLLALTRPTLRNWELSWRSAGLAVRRVDDSALRLRRLIRDAADGHVWVEGVFNDLTLLLGRGLPQGLRGFARRVMEYPAMYGCLSGWQPLARLSPGALKARFRRRGLPSPAVYLRWFRMVAAASILSDGRHTTLSASFRMGFTSDGNFCRWVQSTSGRPPSTLRNPESRMGILFRLVEECFPEGSVEGWSSLGDLFLREVA